MGAGPAGHAVPRQRRLRREKGKMRGIRARRISPAAAVWIAVAAWWGMPVHARAERKLVDRVVAVVEDHAIFKSDIEQTLKQFLMQKGQVNPKPEEREELERQVLKELVDSKLVLAKAQSLGIDVTFSEVEKAVERALAENMRALGGEAAFKRQLEAENLTMDGLRQLYREQLRNRMLVDRVLARELDRSSIKITDEDLRAAYEARKNELPSRPAVVHLRTVYLSLESSENAKAQAKARIEELRRRIMAGEDFAKVAREGSDDPSGKNGGALGSLKLSDLSDRAFADAAAALEIGEVSEPVLTAYGYHLIQVTGADSTTGEVTLRHILVRVKPGDQDIKGVFARATKIHEALVAGAPFDSVAMRESDDPSSAPAGGDLGWLRVTDLPQFFQDVLAAMAPGDISQVLREPTGFRIVQLLEREDARPYEFEEVREELRKLVEQQKMTAAYDKYLEGLRREFYVDIRVN